MAEMDQGIKRLLQTHPADVLELALPGVEYLEPLPAEVATEPQLLMDTLFRVRYRGVECGVNIEAQASTDPQMPRRCFEYGSRASVVFGLPVLSVVLWLERHGAVPTPPYQMLVGDWAQATWQFLNIEVYELPAPAVVATEQLSIWACCRSCRSCATRVSRRLNRRRGWSRSGRRQRRPACWLRCWRCLARGNTATTRCAR